MRQLRHKIVVITGAGSGIGRATAVAFADQGARVHGADVREDRLVELHRELDERALDFSGHVLDVRDPEAVEGLAQDVYEERGRVDVLFNNAGVVVGGPVQHLTQEDWRLAVDVNLMGVIHGIHAFVPRMILQGGGGHIVNTGSIAGIAPFPMVAPYTATKFAIVGLSGALDAELAPHDIRVSCLCPGAVRTSVMQDGVLGLPGRGRELLDRYMKRFALSPEDVAAEVLDDVRRGRSGLRTFGLGSKPLWLFRRGSVAAYELFWRELGRRVL
jgi:NADP-dependent 3-hydroxy acid dehydrogenase YdfG